MSNLPSCTWNLTIWIWEVVVLIFHVQLQIEPFLCQWQKKKMIIIQHNMYAQLFSTLQKLCSRLTLYHHTELCFVEIKFEKLQVVWHFCNGDPHQMNISIVWTSKGWGWIFFGTCCEKNINFKTSFNWNLLVVNVSGLSKVGGRWWKSPSPKWSRPTSLLGFLSVFFFKKYKNRSLAKSVTFIDNITACFKTLWQP